MTFLVKTLTIFFLSFLLTWILFNDEQSSFFEKSNEVPTKNTTHFCGTPELTEQLFRSNPKIKKAHDKLETEAYNYFNNNPVSSLGRSSADYTLPVVVHIIHNNGPENISDAVVLQGIQHLNESFANSGYYNQGTGINTQIEFCLAQRDPQGNAINGITRDVSILTNMIKETQDLTLKNINRWDPTNYINIWIVNEICSINNDCAVGGYAYLPSSHGSDHDGIVIEATWMGSSNANSTVLVHEMGHYLGLYHTFKGGCTNTNCLVNGDRVCDTPPDQSTAGVPCNATANTCSTDVNAGDPNNPFSTDQNDMFWNYMDYGNLSCFSAFTSGQSDRMAFFINGARSSLLASEACTPACTIPIEASFNIDTNPVNVGTTVNFLNASTGATNFEWQIDGIPFSNSTNANYNFSEVGFYVITLNATNNDPNCFETFSDIVEVLCPVDAGFTTSENPVSLGNTVDFLNISSGTTNFEWLIDGIPFSNNTNVVYNFTTEGTFVITLIATDNNFNCAENISDTIEVICPAEASFVPDNTIVPVNETITFTNSSNSAISYEWFVNGISQGNPIDFSLSLSNPGVVEVCLEAAGSNCTDVYCAFISITSSSEGCYHTFEKTIGTTGYYEGGNSIIKSPDGNLLLTGYRNGKALIIKITPNGEILWQRSFNFTDFADRISDIIIDSESNIVGCGIGTGQVGPNTEIIGFAFKYDYANNSMIWVKTLDQGCFTFNIIEPSLGTNYILIASSPIPWNIFNLNEKAIIFELDRNTGETTNNLGFNYFAESNGAFTTTILHNDALYATGHFIDDQWDQFHRRNLISKLDLNGNVSWFNFSFLPISEPGRLLGKDIIEDENHFITTIAGETGIGNMFSDNFFLQKSNMDGSLIWLKEYGNFGYDKINVEELISVTDGYVIFGNVYDSDPPGPEAARKLFLLKIDKDGAIQWLNYFEGDTEDLINSNSFHGKYYQSQVIEHLGHIYFTAAKIDSSGYKRDILLIKTDLDGNVSSGCETESGMAEVEPFPDPQNSPYTILKRTFNGDFYIC